MKVAVKINGKNKIFLVEPTDSLLSLRNKVSTSEFLALSDVVFSKMTTTGIYSRLEGDSKTLKDLGFKSNELLLLDNLSFSVKPATTNSLSKVQSKTTINKRGELVEEKIQEEVEVQEDEIDKILAKEDGWVKQNLELDTSRTKKIEDLGIAPWDIMKHEPWKSMELPHLAFHAWSRSPKAKFEIPQYRKPKSNAWSLQNLQEIKIERQEYRHIDNVLFEHKSIGEGFVKGWVDSGTQQYGWLYGTYVKDEKIPLGITCLISAIYTPSSWRPMPEDEISRVDKFASLFGLKRVGWVWSALGPKKSAGRLESNPLISNEIYYMSKYQEQFPSPCSKSHTGYFGSKFVSVLAFDTVEGQPHFRSFQLSNQASKLVHERNIKVSSKHHNTFYISKSNDTWEYPSIVFNETTGEEGARKTVEKKVDGHNLPADVVPFFLVTQPVTFPKHPRLEIFASFRFPCVFDKNAKLHGSWRDAQKIISDYIKLKDPNVLRDFHLLLWLFNNVDEELVLRLIDGLRNKYDVSEVVTQIQTLGDQKHPQSIQNFPTQSLPMKSDTSSTSQTKNQTIVNVEHKTTLMVMFGCSEQKAEEALLATENNIDAAANLILSEI
jgi:nuclear protein localization family protein 4